MPPNAYVCGMPENAMSHKLSNHPAWTCRGTSTVLLRPARNRSIRQSPSINAAQKKAMCPKTWTKQIGLQENPTVSRNISAMVASTAKMPATISMSRFCFNRSTGMRLMLYRCAAMRTESCTRNEGTTARAAKAGAVYWRRGLPRMHLSPSGTVALRSRRTERRIINRSGRRHASPGGLVYTQDKKANNSTDNHKRCK